MVPLRIVSQFLIQKIEQLYWSILIHDAVSKQWRIPTLDLLDSSIVCWLNIGKRLKTFFRVIVAGGQKKIMCKGLKIFKLISSKMIVCYNLRGARPRYHSTTR